MSSSLESSSTVAAPPIAAPGEGVQNAASSDQLSPTTAAVPALPAASQRRIHYAEEGTGPSTVSAPPALSVNAQLANSHGHGHDHSRPMSDSDLSVHGANSAVDDPGSLMSPTIPPSLRRRGTRRAVTFRNVDNFSDYEVRPGWQPGAEPGIDTKKPDGGRETLAKMMSPSAVTVVDFSQDDIVTTRLDNATLAGFLAVPQPAHMKCRWINVNGLSWDVIQMLGNYKNLHRLAIEDLINTRNRTKADWYPTHTFMILTLQKLVHFDYAKNRISRSDDSDSSDSSDSDGDDLADDKNGASVKSGRSGHSHKSGISRRFTGIFGRRRGDATRGKAAEAAAPPFGSRNLESGPRPLSRAPSMRDLEDLTHVNAFRTLQRYHSSPNDARTDFMESHSALSSRSLAVAAEQVSMFITDDNTIISFFELSAQDVEQPILKRLRLPDTSLRRSCDASMIAQAILDAIIDLAIPVTVCYSDVIADLELDVLTSPSVNHTKCLYITITEMNKVLSFINPVMNLINTLRDHKTDNVAVDDFQNPAKGVTISP
jgi:Mg2+ and Co2+ transporter CorA